MAGVTYKCPNCGAYLTYDPDGGKWRCPFCSSLFEESDLAEKEEAYQQEAAQEAQQQENEGKTEGTQVVYHCPNCGSEVTTDETTVATHCYYCHSPVVLQGKLTEDMKPDEVLPFSIGREKAEEQFMSWVRSKRFVPKGFFSKERIQELSGVYYPHFVNECDVEGSYQGEGTNSTTMDMGKYIVTKTDHYRVEREGRFRFSRVMRPALSRANRKLSDGIHPFPLEEAKPFAGTYLSGFLAERRDVEADSFRQEIEQEVNGYVQTMFRDSVGQYDTVSGSSTASLQEMESKYVLLPTWVLTYPNKKEPDDPYYYAMNGCTGEICGKLPVDNGKLWRFGLLIGAAVAAVCCLIGYFLL